jgi:hypothetical protein
MLKEKLYVAGLNEPEANRALYFDKLLNNQSMNKALESKTFSATALQAALFIILYRYFPVFQFLPNSR